ncbi:hypothetical protein [Fluviicola chungangensis]|uniref:Uncharacterized protein n=1 Tax=Fluviicola chungangensis TaxID=2597671 RepID=A0A556MQU9_9FLAO|nr:hypothetical protein [Fluviicola chungangensis]TSJ42300.1 hypothetical protein FO442_11065 [Fluviicola chungangensis]
MDKFFNACVEALGKEKEVYDEERTIRAFNRFLEAFSFAVIEINWEKYPDHKVISGPKDLKGLKLNDCFIFWNEGRLPAVKTTFSQAIKCRQKIAELSPFAWIVGANYDWVLEFHSQGKVRFTFAD